MKLVEQQQTTERMNQTLLLQTTQRYDETISKLVAKLDQLETTVAKLDQLEMTVAKLDQLETTVAKLDQLETTVAKLDQLETTVQTQKFTLMNATTCIGIGSYCRDSYTGDASNW